MNRRRSSCIRNGSITRLFQVIVFTNSVHIFETEEDSQIQDQWKMKFEMLYQKEDWKMVWRQCHRKGKISNGRGFCKMQRIIMYLKIQVKNRQIQDTMESNGFSIFTCKIYRLHINILLLHGKHSGRESAPYVIEVKEEKDDRHM